MYIESVCARVCVHTYMCIYINDKNIYIEDMCVRVCVHTYDIPICVELALPCTPVHKYVYTHSFCACVHVCVYIYMYIFTYTCVRIAEERDHPREKDREGTRKKRSTMCSSVLRIGLFCSWICFARRAILLVGRFFKRE